MNEMLSYRVVQLWPRITVILLHIIQYTVIYANEHSLFEIFFFIASM